MTRTSATRPTREAARGKGFSLLEMLVVLALMGLLVALVAPAGFRMVASWRRATQAEDILGQLASLPDVARQGARPITLSATGQDPAILTLPEGWRLELEGPLEVRANGACSGAEGVLIDEDDVPIAFALQAPYCRIRLADR
jgi:prepilin-type N-terminal cleavage/methylation domain-containing protein